MNIRCPQCGTAYSVDEQPLNDSQGMVRCHQCGKVFNALEHRTDDIELQLELGNEEDPNSFNPDLELNLETEQAPTFSTQDPAASTELPFDVPEDLPTLEPTGDGALDTLSSLETGRRERAPWWQKFLVFLLLVTLLLQLAWITRAEWLKLPQAKPLCEWIDCRVAEQRDLEAFVVVERQLRADPTVPGSLRLLVRFSNQAEFAQPLPQLQLSLFDSSGTVLARRLFGAEEYLFPAPSKGALAQAQEVFTIELLFEDPGVRASGFKIDFL